MLGFWHGFGVAAVISVAIFLACWPDHGIEGTENLAYRQASAWTDLSKLQISYSSVHGKGVFAAAPFYKDDFVAILYFTVDNIADYSIPKEDEGEEELVYRSAFITSNGDLGVAENMTLAEAMADCREVQDCAGITFFNKTFDDDDSSMDYSNTHVRYTHFKGHSNMAENAGWHSFVKPSKSQQLFLYPLECHMTHGFNFAELSLTELLPCYMRFLNHGCGSTHNVVVRPRILSPTETVDGLPGNGKRRIIVWELFATRNIVVGEELLFNYLAVDEVRFISLHPKDLEIYSSCT
jgi:hypothetical protein